MEGQGYGSLVGHVLSLLFLQQLAAVTASQDPARTSFILPSHDLTVLPWVPPLKGSTT